MAEPANETNKSGKRIVVIPGQGIGPECIDATKKVLSATGLKLDYVEGHLGYPDAKELFTLLGYNNPEQEAAKRLLEAKGAAKAAGGKESDYYKYLLSSLAKDERQRLDAMVLDREKAALKEAMAADAVLKGALRTLDEGSQPSKNVTIRKMFEQYANMRRCVDMRKDKNVDILFVRENVEDLYAAIEHRLGRNYTQALRHITPEGCELIARAAFEAALKEGRKKVTGLEKPNILKITGGMFKETFMRVAKEYEKLGISSDFQIIDDGLAAIAKNPEYYDVVVTTNMFGDIGSDVAAKVTGGVGLVSSNNINPLNPRSVSMFETMGGTADDIAGQNKANPVALIDAAAEMLIHMGGKANVEAGQLIKIAILEVLNDGYFVGDMKESLTGKGADFRLGTQQFAEKVASKVAEFKQKLDADPSLNVSDMLSKANELRSKMRSYDAAIAAEIPGSDAWIAKMQRNIPPNPVRAQSRMKGFDLFVDNSGVVNHFNADGSVDETKSGIRIDIALNFHKQTGIDVEDIFSTNRFGSVQAIRSRGQYFAERLKEYLSHHQTNQSLVSLLQQWKISDEVISGFNDKFLAKSALEAEKELSAFSSNSKLLVQALYLVMDDELSSVLKKHGFKMVRMTSRGTEMFPTMGDSETREVHRVRIEVDEKGHLADKIYNLKVVQDAMLSVEKELVEKGWVLPEVMLNRQFKDAEGAKFVSGADKSWVDGVSMAYGNGLGEPVKGRGAA